MSEERGNRKTRVGVVIKAKMDKSCVVEVERRLAHPLYKKVIRRNSRFMVHDEEGRCRVGDVVRIVETRPLSKRKRWRYVETVRSAESAEV
jgi:small subunit ribosomal protein S17